MKREPIFLREPIVFDKQNNCDIENPYGYIYLTTCFITGTRYIGQHYYPHPFIDLSYYGSGNLIIRAIKKYGKDNFSVQILKWCDSLPDLIKSELEFIECFHAVESSDFYNIQYESHGFLSGELHPYHGITGKDAIAYGNNYFKGKHHTDSSKRKQHIAAMRPEIMEKNKNNLKKAVEHNIGRPLSEEHKRNISDSLKSIEFNKGKNNVMYGRVLGKHPRAKPVIQLSVNGDFIREYSCIKETELYGFNKTCVRDCCNGVQSTHSGFKWKYKFL